MERTVAYTTRNLFMNAVTIELRIFRAIYRTVLDFLYDLVCFVLGIDFRERR